MIHYAGYTPRFHPSDFDTPVSDGVGADWPISYEDLKPYYEAIEEELPVSGQPWPWGDPHRYPYSPQPLGGNGEVFVARRRTRSASRPGWARSPSPTAGSATGPTASTGASASRAAR